MNYIEPTGDKIMIMADYGAYAWDNDNAAGDLDDIVSDYTEDQYCSKALDKLDEKFEQWAGNFWESAYDEKGFPYETFHQQGIELTKELVELLNGSGIRITYQRPFEDPKGKNYCEIEMNNIFAAINMEVINKLHQIEKDYQVKILLAVESGMALDIPTGGWCPEGT